MSDTLQREINISNPQDLPYAIHRMFFYGDSVTFNGTKVLLQSIAVRGGTIKKAKVGDFLYLEQNPHKSSFYGQLAQQGSKILWIIFEPTKNLNYKWKPGKYIARMIDGQFERLV